MSAVTYSAMEGARELEQEILRLREENEQLALTVDTMRQQLARAAPAEKSLEEIRDRCVSLQARVREAESDRDDLKRKLEISMQRIEDLNSDLEHETLQRTTNSSLEAEAAQRKLEENKMLYDKEIEKLKAEIQTRDQSLGKLKLRETEISAILKAACQHFATEVRDVEHLLQLLLVPPISDEPVEEVVAPKPKKVKQKKETYNCFELEAKELKERLEQVQREMDLEIESAQNQLQRLRNEKSDVERENDKLRQELARFKADVESNEISQKSENLQQVLSLSEQLKSTTKQLNESERQKETLKKQITPLITRIRVLERAVKQLKVEVVDSRAERKKLAEEKDSLVNDYNALLDEHDEVDSVNKDLEIRTTQLEDEKRALKEKLNQMDEEVEKLALMKESLERIMAEDNEAHENYRKQIEGLTQISEQNAHLYETAKRQYEDEVKARTKAEDEAKALKEQLMQSREPVEITELLGIAALTADSFPVDLAELINDACANPTLRSPSKLRRVMLIISEYFRAKQERLEAEVSRLTSNKSEVKSSFDDFTDILRRLFPEHSFPDLPVNAEAQEQFKLVIEQLQSDRETALERFKALDGQLVDLLLMIGADNTEAAKSLISEERDLTERLKERLASLTAAHKTLKAAMRSEKKNNEAHLVLELRHYRETVASLKSEYEARAAEDRTTCESLRSKCNVLKQENAELSARVPSLESAIERVHSELAAQKAITSTLASEKSELEELVKRHEKTLRLREKRTPPQPVSTPVKSDVLSDDVQEYVRRCTGALEERVKCLTMDVLRLQDELASETSEKKREHQRADDLELRLQKCSLELELAQKKEERERRLVDENRRHDKVLHDGSLRRAASEMNAKLAAAKREVMTMVALHFSALFDVGVELNDSNFNEMLQVVRNRMTEFVERESRLRRIMALGPNQSIEAEVARIVLDKRM